MGPVRNIVKGVRFTFTMMGISVHAVGMALRLRQLIETKRKTKTSSTIKNANTKANE